MRGSTLRALLDDAISTAEGEPEALYVEGCLHPEEEAAIERAVPKRRKEYGAARLLARALFARYGLPPLPVLNREDRSPIWPDGYVGSITHTTSFCGVALAPARALRGLGIDAEQAGPMQAPIVARVTTERERAAMARAGYESTAVATLWFSAKESVYKCLHPTVRRFIGFSEVELVVDFDAGRFRAEAAGTEWDRGHVELVERLEGRFLQTNGVWITSSVLRHE